MQQEGTRDAGRLGRWLLLACTVFGLATMHTLGHAGVHTHAHDHAAAAHGAPVGSPAGHCDGDCAHTPAPSPHGGTVGWSVCLAVLGVVAILFLLAVLVRPARRRERHASVADPWSAPSRGPPAGPAGLALVAVSVLRI